MYIYIYMLKYIRNDESIKIICQIIDSNIGFPKLQTHTHTHTHTLVRVRMRAHKYTCPSCRWRYTDSLSAEG